MNSLPPERHPDLLVGYDTSDDAGVFRLTEDLALVQTVDFITPVVDDPFTFGMIAAANSLSDVYAMGGRPLTVMNILCFPSGDLPLEVAKQILQGGHRKIAESGAVLLGGHSLKDKELKYGLSVTGVISPGRILTNAGAREGDRIILTKPIGTGLISTALKGGAASEEAAALVAEVASTLNRAAAEVMLEFEVHACTDITGFGLGGHLLEVARASGADIHLMAEEIPLMPSAAEYAGRGLIPAGSYANRKYCRDLYEMDKRLAPVFEDLVFDPQTSGGLAIFLSPREAEDCLLALHGRGVKWAHFIGEVAGRSSCGNLKIL